ncbi:MAG: CvpA family protein [Bacteroidales bacterium]|nr:CvpA family protein [Bacteroidales bacterium]
MNTLDIVILILFIPGIIRGITKGFMEQAISLAGIVLSVYVAYHFSSYACNFIQKYITVSETVLHILGFTATLIAVLIVVLLLAKLFTKAVEMASLGWLNKALGFLFSILTTALVLGLLAIVFDTLNVKFGLVKSNILQDSVLYGHLKDFGYLVFPYMKQLLHLGA